MKKKIIGLSSSLDKDNHCYCPHEYVEMLEKLGATSIIIPIVDDVNHYINMIDGLILIGGHDISPSIYMQSPHELLEKTLEIRDEFDKKLFFKAREKNIPILGVCRGHQLINCLMGGTLYQDLSLNKNININHRDCEHKIVKLSGFIKELFNENDVVNSYHHQIIDKLAPNFKACAYSEDGAIEACSFENIYTVQWHPELMKDLKVFKYFLEVINE